MVQTVVSLSVYPLLLMRTTLSFVSPGRFFWGGGGGWTSISKPENLGYSENRECWDAPDWGSMAFCYFSVKDVTIPGDTISYRTGWHHELPYWVTPSVTILGDTISHRTGWHRQLPYWVTSATAVGDIMGYCTGDQYGWLVYGSLLLILLYYRLYVNNNLYWSECFEYM